MNEVQEAFDRQRQITKMGEKAEPELLVTFRIKEAFYAIHIENAREVVEGGHVTPFPTDSDGFEGMLNLRGSLVPLIDGAVLLHNPTPDHLQGEAPWTHQTRYIVIDSESGDRIGIRAAEVTKVFVQTTVLEEAAASETRLLSLDGSPFKIIDPDEVFLAVEGMARAAS